jgi:hypothetical protein
MSDYQKGKVYNIKSKNTPDVYVGSTIQILTDRLANHVFKNKQHKLGLENDCTSFRIIDLGDYEIVLIEDYPCNSAKELQTRERYWIENTPNCINKNIPTQTKKEYYEKNKEKIIAQTKEYAKNHPEINKKKKG